MGTFTAIRLEAKQPRVRFGFPLLPANTTIDNPAPAQVIGGGTPEPQVSRNPLINATVPLGFWRLTARLNTELFSGSFAGFGLTYIVSGETRNDGTGDLRVRLDEVEGGVAFGFNVTLDTTIRLERGVGFRLVLGPGGGVVPRSWEDAFNQSFSPNLDLIQIALIAFNLATGGTLPLEQIRAGQTIGSNGNVWGLFDERDNRYAADNQIQLRPTLAVSVNIFKLIPKVGTAIKVMGAIGLTVTQGPIFNFIFPITIRLVRLTTVDGTYDVQNTRGPFAGTVRLLNGPVTNTSNNITDVDVVHEHDVGFRFRLEIQARISFLGLISIGERGPLPFQIFPTQPRAASGINTILGPFFTEMSSSGTTAQAELPEVVWG